MNPIAPRAGTATDIGANDRRFRDVFFSGSLSDGTNIATAAQLASLIAGGGYAGSAGTAGAAAYAAVAGTVYGMGAGGGTAYADLSGSAVYAGSAGTSGYALVAGTVYGAREGTQAYALLAGSAIAFSGTAPYALQAGTALYAISGGTGGPAVGGTADYSTYAGSAFSVAYAGSAGTAGQSAYALVAGTVYGMGSGGGTAYADLSGSAVYAGSAGTSGWSAQAGTSQMALSLSGTYADRFVSRRVLDDMKDPSGFLNRTDSSILFNGSGREFTISGTYDIYSHGTLFRQTDGTLIIDATPGNNFIFYGTTGALSQVQGFPGFDQALVASVYYNGTKGLLAEERHGISMSHATHEYLHDTVRCRYESGLAGTFGDSSFSLSAGTIADEDLEIGIDTQTSCQVMYRRAGVWDWTTPQGSYYYSDETNLYYDNNGTITAATSNQYVASWVYATTDPVNPTMVIMGQRQDVLIANARANNTPDSLALTVLPYAEMKLLYRVILRNDATPYEEVADYRAVTPLPASNYVATDHLTLSNIGQYKHTEIDAFINGSQCGTAEYSKYAGSAFNSVYSGSAGTSGFATLAGTAIFSTLAGSSFNSASANYAGSAGTAGASAYATVSGTVWNMVVPYAGSAGTSGWAPQAGTSQTALSFYGTAPASTIAGTALYVNGTVAYALNSNALGGTGIAAISKLASVNTYTAAQIGSITALSDGGTIPIDMALNNFFSVTLAGNRTLNNPTNIVAAQSGAIFITQDGTGSRTMAYGSCWDFAGGAAPTLSTGTDAVDRLDYVTRTTTSIHAVLTKAWA